MSTLLHTFLRRAEELSTSPPAKVVAAVALPVLAYSWGVQGYKMAFVAVLALPVLACILSIGTQRALRKTTLSQSHYTAESFMLECLMQRRRQQRQAHNTTFWLLVTFGSAAIFAYLLGTHAGPP